MVTSSMAAALSASDLFRGLNPELIRGSFIKEFKRGDTVSEIQNGIDCLGIVIFGSLSVAANEGSSVSVMKRGGEFGICNIFVKEDMPTLLKARVQSSVCFIPKEEFIRLLSKDSSLMYRYVRLCNEKMLYLAARLRLISISDCTERLMYYLKTKAVNGEVKLSVSKDELARQLGISRSSLFRALLALESDGRITQNASRIVLN